MPIMKEMWFGSSENIKYCDFTWDAKQTLIESLLKDERTCFKVAAETKKDSLSE